MLQHPFTVYCFSCINFEGFAGLDLSDQSHTHTYTHTYANEPKRQWRIAAGFLCNLQYDFSAVVRYGRP